MLTNVQELATKLENVENVRKELKRVQSIKCRLLKQKAKETYEIEMSKVLEYEQTLKEVRTYFEPKDKPYTMYTKEDIDKLNYDETIKAIKSIQSKKCNSQYLTKDISTNEIYQDACRIEQLLLEHKKTVKPIEATVVKKSDINNLIEHMSNQESTIPKEYIIEQLQKLLLT